MKKIVMIIAVLFSISTIHAQVRDTAILDGFLHGKAPKKRVHGEVAIHAGFMLAPQGSFDLNHLKKGSDGFIGYFATTSIGGDKFSFTAFYSLFGNAYGASPSYQFTKNFGTYLVASDNVLNDGNYLGTGATWNVANGLASAFIEFGSSLNRWTPTIYVGTFIPLTCTVAILKHKRK